MERSYYSQFKQDLNIIEFFNKTEGLYFLDIGANDGKTFSNTYLLEKKYNWNGICSEPLPSAFKKLQNCRNVICNDSAVFSESNLTLKFSVSNIISGITDYIDCHMGVKNKKQIEVKTITLQDLVKKYNSPNIIHYLSLDTEGTELEILKSINLSEYKFLYINVEHNFIEPKRTQIRDLLENNGYLYKGENNVDDDYIHESIIMGTYYYNNDNSKPIIIKRNNKYNFSVSSPYWNDDIGIFDQSILKWNNLGEGKIYYNYIDYGNGNIWYKKI